MVDPVIPDLPRQLEVASAALRRSEERAIAGQLALELMHEIKNPLEALGHLIYLACEEADNAGAVRAYMQLAEEQMATVSQIIDQTLGLTRALTPTQVDLGALAESAIRIHRRKLESKRVRVVKSFSSGVLARVYPGQILQVISNLIANSVDALPEEGTIFLRLRRQNDGIVLVVADTGHGIRPEDVASIYELFFSTKQEQGTGLGLALSKKIIERHGGRIAVRSSVRPGRSGTVFRILLPG
jgi:signal transduction histidine kinase